MAENLKLTVKVTARGAKSFKDENGIWYNIDNEAKEAYEKIKKEDTITITYYKKNVSNYVIALVIGASETPKTKCEVCGKELKNSKYKKCYDCNKASPKKEENKAETQEGEFKCEDCGAIMKTNKYKKCFICNKKSPRKTAYKTDPETRAAIEKGNSLNAAAAAASGAGFSDPNTAAEFTLMLADKFLEWLRNNN